MISISHAKVGQRAERLGDGGVGFEKNRLRLGERGIGLEWELGVDGLEVRKIDGIAVEIGAAIDEDGIFGESPSEGILPMRRH